MEQLGGGGHQTVAGAQFGTDGTLIFADCGLYINPSSDELSEIAIASAHSWSTFMGNVEPHVAMPSYSTMVSAVREVAKKVQEAVKFCKEKAPELAIDGDLLTLDFRDEGAPFDPLSTEPPDLEADIMDRPIGGLGLYLIRQIAEETHYRRVDDANLLRVTLRIPQAESSP